MFDDPFAIDRRLREAARAWLAWRRALRSGAGEEHRFERLGAYASGELVRELYAASAVDPLAPALFAWAYRLHLEHATRELAISRERAFRAERHGLAAPESGKFTLREMLGAALADTKGARSAWLRALVTSGREASAFELRRVERRDELLGALGDLSPDSVELPIPDIALRAGAFLERTDGAFHELGAKDASGLVELALGRGSIASWPSRLSARSLAGFFDESNWLAHATFELDELPKALGAASFVRGLAAFGAALRTALAGPSLPFALAHDPFDLAGSTYGALFALVPLGESFAKRKLEVARARLADHRRQLSRVLLVSARVLALRTTLRDPTRRGKEALLREYPDLAFRALGVELEPEAATLLFRSRVSDPARFAGLLLGAERARRLEDVHDEDWYRNPRAVDELRETARLAVERKATSDALDAGSRELERHLSNIA